MPPKARTSGKRSKKTEEQKQQDEMEFEFRCSLIEAVQGYPVIYDKAHPQHKKDFARNEAWQQIADALFCPGNYNLLCTYSFETPVIVTIKFLNLSTWKKNQYNK